MGFRLIPLLEQRPLAWTAAPWLVLTLLTLGNLLRVSGQTLQALPLFATGGTAQVLAALAFSLSLGWTLVRRRPDTAEAEMPAWASF
jgi:hypothetical protein